MPAMKIYGVVSAIVLFTALQTYSQGTTREERTITAKQLYKCTYDGACYELRFKTPEEGCKHWATHLPGYTYNKTVGVNDVGAVTCICKKGTMVNDQGGMIRGEVVCADELAVPITENKTFLETTTCECPNNLSPPYYVAFNNKCVLDECDTRNMSQDALLQWATTQLQKIVDEENEAFAANTGRVNDPNVVGPKPLISDKEYEGWGLKFGIRPTPAGPFKYNDSAYAIAYGHAVERLAAVRVSKDLCLSRVLQYVPNSQQTKGGGQPDFKGKGDLKSGDFDVTTVEQAKKKKQPYIFITYTRLIQLDENGNNIPRKPKTP